MITLIKGKNQKILKNSSQAYPIFEDDKVSLYGDEIFIDGDGFY